MTTARRLRYRREARSGNGSREEAVLGKQVSATGHIEQSFERIYVDIEISAEKGIWIGG